MIKKISCLSIVLLCLSFSVDAPEGHIRVRYEVMEVPFTFPSHKPPADKPNPKQGVGKPLLLKLL